ncbi:NAD(P)/FAD-dependent oxidoreductase [Candidatus Poribacteria bacterium]|nr:NAD(P)/FAD-dependent oxidoreductase [Candidatus Poribacteria bacterium]
MTGMSQKVYDVAVIGGGVVGCAVLRAFTLAGLKCVLLERGADILSGASKGNSAILHTGFDAPPGSLEHKCVQEGCKEYLEIHERLNLPLVRSSALVVAWTEEQFRSLPDIVEKAHKNGVADVTQIALEDLYGRETNLSAGAKGAVLVPGESYIDPWSAPLAYAHQALANGADIFALSEVQRGEFDAGHWKLMTPGGLFKAGVVINCAGNFGDIVEAINRPSAFRITPRKGQFLVYDKPAADLLQCIILPVPTKRTKGVVVFRTVFGKVVVGPTAEDQEDRELADVTEKMLRDLKAKGESIIPGLASHEIIATYAGLRPATQFDDYQIDADRDRHWITVAGIRSTGLTASLGIAKHVLALYEEKLGRLNPIDEPVWTPVPNLAEHRPRAYQKPDAGELVCLCEMVTRKEMEDALSSLLPPGDMGGLKRRTRCTMGRCQGYYCGHKVAQLAQGRLKEPSQ